MIRCFVSTMTYLLPKRTINVQELSLPQSQKNAWVLVYKVPVKLISVLKDPQRFKVNSFTATNCPVLTSEEYTEYLQPAVVEDGKIFTDAYPRGYVTETDFDDRDKVKNLMTDLNKLKKDIPAVKTFLDMQPASTQGNAKILNFEKIKDYDERRGAPDACKYPDMYGHDSYIFNRASHHAPPHPILTKEEWRNHHCFPRPLGVRPTDHATPQETYDTIMELVTQLYNCEGIDKSKFTGLPLEDRAVHRCRFCDEVVDVSQAKPKHGSETNYMELCHRNPNGRFTRDNLYLGHGVCNRMQGGCTEEQIVSNGIRLMRLLEREKDSELFKAAETLTKFLD
jgi:hypothetical protein